MIRLYIKSNQSLTITNYIVYYQYNNYIINIQLHNMYQVYYSICTASYHYLS